MRLLKTRSLAAVFALASLASAAYAQPGRWEFLGETHVDGRVDHDRIMVTGARGTFRAIRLRVQAAPVEFDRVVVHFGNGSSDPIAIRHIIEPGRQTRVIDLPGNRRVIQSVEFWYRKADWRSRRPSVQLFGLR